MIGLRYLLRGIKRSQGNAHNRVPRVPVTRGTRSMLTQVLMGIRNVFSVRDASMVSAALLLAFFGMLRVYFSFGSFMGSCAHIVVC